MRILFWISHQLHYAFIIIYSCLIRNFTEIIYNKLYKFPINLQVTRILWVKDAREFLLPQSHWDYAQSHKFFLDFSQSYECQITERDRKSHRSIWNLSRETLKGHFYGGLMAFIRLNRECWITRSLRKYRLSRYKSALESLNNKTILRCQENMEQKSFAFII